MNVICSEVRFVEIASPNECDKILKIPNEQTEPTDYMANCSKDCSKDADQWDLVGTVFRKSKIFLFSGDTRRSEQSDGAAGKNVGR